jgi:hypothetical protein
VLVRQGDLPHGVRSWPAYSFPFNAHKLGACHVRRRCMNYLNRFNQGGFSLWWTYWSLQAIFYAWVVASLLGFFLHSKRFSELGNMLSDIFLYIVLLTAVVQAVLRVFRQVKSH